MDIIATFLHVASYNVLEYFLVYTTKKIFLKCETMYNVRSVSVVFHEFIVIFTDPPLAGVEVSSPALFYAKITLYKYCIKI